MSRYFSGVRGRVMLTVVAVTAALYSILGVVGFLLIANSGRNAIRERIDQVLDQLEASARAGSTTIEVTTPDGVQAQIISIVPASSSTAPVTASGGAPGSASTSLSEGTGVITVVRHVTIGTTSLTLTGRASQARLTDSLRSLHRGVWIGVPLAVLVTGVMAGIATGRALRPVADITELADSIGRDATVARVPVPDTGDEIEHLARTVNAMLDRIGDGQIAQRQFTSDAAHELRTPLMAIQGEIEIAAEHPDLSDGQLLERLAELSARLGARVDDLVLLSALDESRPTETEALALVPLIRDEALGVDPAITVDGDSSIAVRVDRPLIARAVRNLLSNAKRHAASAVEVHVEVAAASSIATSGAASGSIGSIGRDPAACSAGFSAGRSGVDVVRMHVDDDGPGVDPAMGEQVFRRFARLSEARSLDGGGSGLGLAIVASVARAHGGDVAVTRSPLGGARFTLTLPAAAPPVTAPPSAAMGQKWEATAEK